MTEIRTLTQDETDLLHFIKKYRRNISAVTNEEWDLLIRLSDEFPRPMPTEFKKELDYVLDPFRKLLAESSGPVDRSELAKAIEVFAREAP